MASCGKNNKTNDINVWNAVVYRVSRTGEVKAERTNDTGVKDTDSYLRMGQRASGRAEEERDGLDEWECVGQLQQQENPERERDSKV